jgi:hypothetical protein
MVAKKTFLRLDLDGELNDKFLYLKEKMGMHNNTEVIRALILQAYEKRAG